MDSDIRENLKELGDHIQAVGRQIASTKSSQESITAMRECLKDGAKTLDIYLGIQKKRYKI